MAAAVAALITAGASPALLAAFVILEGAGYGVTAISRPVVSATVLGRDGFGAISGALALPFIGATALAPTFGAALWSFATSEEHKSELQSLMRLSSAVFCFKKKTNTINT